MKTIFLAAALVLVGCSSTTVATGPPAPTPTLTPARTAPTSLVVAYGDSGPFDLGAGRYRVAWTADCDSFFLEWAPTGSAEPVEIPSPALPSGEAIVDLPAGPAYLNRGGSCSGNYSVTITAVN